MRLSLFSSKQCIIKQLLDSVFVISGIIKVSVSVMSLSLRLRLITLSSTLIIPDITKTSSSNCLLSDADLTKNTDTYFRMKNEPCFLRLQKISFSETLHSRTYTVTRCILHGTKASVKRSPHFNAPYRNIVERNRDMLRAFSHPVQVY